MEPKHPRNLVNGINDHTVRVLFVIPRIRGESGTAYQSTGMRLVNGLCKQCREYFQMEVLHAPTYERLSDRLRKAHREGMPFHIVQYDGHGAFIRPADLEGQGRLQTEADLLEKKLGFLILENSQGLDFVDGKLLGKLLVECGVLILSLSAAHGASAEGRDAGDEEEIVRLAFEDVIQSCLAGGLPDALAAPFFCENDATAVFLGDVYSSLAQGVSLAEAVASEGRYFITFAGRKNAGGQLLPEGWHAPEFYGSGTVQTASRAGLKGTPVFRISVLERGLEIRPERMDARLLRGLPESGVYGRDELTLQIEQAFDHQGVVLLYGDHGTGKTTAAAEFARWQANNGTLGDQPILYTSLAKCANLSDLLEDFGQVYQDALVEHHLIWNDLEDFQRIRLIQDLCKKISLLWIWDDFESVNQDTWGFWDKAERDHLLELMISLADKVSRLLVISNTDEAQIADKIIRIKVTPVAKSSIRALASAWMEKYPPSRLNVNEIIQKIEKNSTNIKVLVEMLKHPAWMTEDALASSPDGLVGNYLKSISPQDQTILALVPLFTRVMNMAVLEEMGREEHPWRLPEIAGSGKEYIQAALARASEFGLLSFISGRYYQVDSTLASCLAALLERMVPGIAVYIAYAHAMSLLAGDLTRRWEQGDKEQIGLLTAEETNLKRALLLAKRFGLRTALAELLMALRLVYLQNQRYVPWARLLNDVAPEYLTPHGKLRRELGSDSIKFIDACIEVSRLRQHFKEAANWQELRVDWERRLAEDILKLAPQSMDREELQVIQNLTSALDNLGSLLDQAGDPHAIDAYKEGFRITRKIKKTELSAYFAYKVARDYISIPAVQNLTVASRWIKKSVNLRAPEDQLGRGQTIALYGLAALEKFMQAQKQNRPGQEQIKFINQALRRYFEALDWLPEGAWEERGMIHETIGYLYFQAENMIDSALDHYDLAIKYKEQGQDVYGAARARFNTAVALFLLTRFELGHNYAVKALKGFESLGVLGMGDVQKTRGLIAKFRNAGA